MTGSPRRYVLSPVWLVVVAALLVPPLHVVAGPGGAGTAIATGAADPAAVVGQGAVEAVETRDGRVFRGRVVGYNREERSYVLECAEAGGTLMIPEDEILTVRAVEGRRASSAPSRSPSPAPERAVVSVQSSSRPREAAVPLPPLNVLEDRGERFLTRLTERIGGSPSGGAARKVFDRGVSHVRKRRLKEAMSLFRKTVELEPGCLAAKLFLAAIHLADADYREAYRGLDRARRWHAGEPLLLEMLAAVSRELGYLRLENRYTEAWILASSSGARRAWRIFQHRRRREPWRALTAWDAYLKEDANLSLIDSPESRRFQRGRAALEGGDATRALVEFAAAVRVNPYIDGVVQPYRVRALEILVSESRGRAVVETAETRQGAVEPAADLADLADLEALRAEAPDLARVEDLRSVVQRGWLTSRLQDVDSAAGVDAVVEERTPWIPDLTTQFFGAVHGRLEELERPVTAPIAASGSVPGGGSAQTLAPTRTPTPAVSSGRTDLELYFPLYRGSWWAYRHGDGTRDTLRLEEIDEHSTHGMVYRYEDEIEFENTTFSAARSCFVDQNSLFMGQGSDRSLAEPILALPIAIGTRWSWRKGSRNDIVCEREYVDVDAEVTCRAGSFKHCLHVRSTCAYARQGGTSGAVVHEYYYARGVGLVKVETENPLDGRELESYSIVNKPGDASSRRQ